MSRFIFHLSIPVADFYVNTLGAALGRETPEWLDILLWDHQITLQLEPENVCSLEQQGKRHFGVVLPWQDWTQFANSIEGGEAVVSGPTIKHNVETGEGLPERSQ